MSKTKKPIKRRREASPKKASDVDANPMQPIPPLETPAPKPDKGSSVAPASRPAPRMRFSRWVSGDKVGIGDDKFGRVRGSPRRSSWLDR